MGTKRSNLFNSSFNTKWTGVTASLIIIVTLIGAGYSAGNYLSELSCERQMLIITEEYQNKIFEHRQSCNYNKVMELEKKTDDIQLTVEQLKKMKNEK